jgi:hypothetical protein
LKKTKIVHFQGLNALNMQKKNWFVSSFEHVNNAINGKYSKKNSNNLNYYVSFVIFQTYTNIVLKSVHSLGWFLWLQFYLTMVSSEKGLRLEIESECNNQMGKRNQNLKPISRY